MATQLVNLRNVPDDEAHELRALLTEHGIAFHESEPSLWGVSMGGIWLTDERQHDEARRLINEYQTQREAQAKADYKAARRAGSVESFLAGMRRHPMQTLVYIGIAVAVLYLSTMPFIGLGGG